MINIVNRIRKFLGLKIHRPLPIYKADVIIHYSVIDMEKLSGDVIDIPLTTEVAYLDGMPEEDYRLVFMS